MSGRVLLAWNLRSLRTRRGLSQEKLAADAGVDRAWVSQIERQQGNTSIDLLDRLAVVLEVPIAELFREPSPGEAKPMPLRGGRKPSG